MTVFGARVKPPSPILCGILTPSEKSFGFRFLSDTAVVRNSLSLINTGCDQPDPEISTFQARWSVIDHVRGMVVDSATPTPLTPRNCGKSVAIKETGRTSQHTANTIFNIETIHREVGVGQWHNESHAVSRCESRALAVASRDDYRHENFVRQIKSNMPGRRGVLIRHRRWMGFVNRVH